MTGRSKSIVRLFMMLGVALGIGWAVVDFVAFAPDRRNFQICASRLRGIAWGLREYAASNGAFPDSLTTLVTSDLATPTELRCPSACDSTEGTIDFDYVAGLRPTDPANWPIVFDKEFNHRSDHARNVLYISGEVKRIDEREFERELRQARRRPIAKGSGG